MKKRLIHFFCATLFVTVLLANQRSYALVVWNEKSESHLYSEPAGGSLLPIGAQTTAAGPTMWGANRDLAAFVFTLLLVACAVAFARAMSFKQQREFKRGTNRRTSVGDLTCSVTAPASEPKLPKGPFWATGPYVPAAMLATGVDRAQATDRRDSMGTDHTPVPPKKAFCRVVPPLQIR
jgi:hypothetical protein